MFRANAAAATLCAVACLVVPFNQAAAQPVDGEYRLRLGPLDFDPLGIKPAIDPDYESAPVRDDQEAWWIVQLNGAPTREQREALKDSGLELTRYVPRHAYVEWATAAKIDAIPGVRARILYHPAFRVPSGLYGRANVDNVVRISGNQLALRATLFHKDDLRDVAAFVKTLAASSYEQIDATPAGGSARVEFLFSPPGIPTGDIYSKVLQTLELDTVRSLEQIVESDEDNNNTAGIIQSGTIGRTPIWDMGIRGTDQVVGVIDSGIITLKPCWFKDPSHNKPNRSHRKVVDVRHGGVNEHATFVAGIVAGDIADAPGESPYRGNAWDARLVSGSRFQMNSLANALHEAALQGARVHTNSWHFKTPWYSEMSADVDGFTWKNEDNVVLGSSGNKNKKEVLGPPCNAKNSICVSAARVNAGRTRVGDGVAGPTIDDRRKPDLVAPGCAITSGFWRKCSTDFYEECATSFATPAAAAAAALARQFYTDGHYPAHTEPTGALIKASLLNASQDIDDDGYPGDAEGWGMPKLDETLVKDAASRDLRVWDVRHAGGLDTGESLTDSLEVVGTDEPLRVTLVWTEPAAVIHSKDALVNDLDLTVTDKKSGKLYRGNVFSGGASTTGGSTDTRNNVEQVLVLKPTAGTWEIAVTGRAVHRVWNDDEAGRTLGGQGFAVVATGDFSVETASAPSFFSVANPRAAAAYPARQGRDVINDLEAFFGVGIGVDSNVFLTDDDDPLAEPESDSHALGLLGFDYRHAREDQTLEYGFAWLGSRVEQIALDAATQVDQTFEARVESYPWLNWKFISFGLQFREDRRKLEERSLDKVDAYAGAVSFQWKPEDRCEMRRAVGYYRYEDRADREPGDPMLDRSGHSRVIGARYTHASPWTFRSRDGNDENAPPRLNWCSGDGVFRKLYLDDHWTMHAGVEHWQDDSAGSEFNRKGWTVNVDGRFPLIRSRSPNPDQQKHPTRMLLDLDAQYTSVKHDNASVFAPRRRDDEASFLDIGFVFPLKKQSDNGFAEGWYNDIDFRTGLAWVQQDSNIPGFSYDRVVFGLTIQIAFGSQRQDGSDDVPDPGSDVSSDTGSGPSRPKVKPPPSR